MVKRSGCPYIESMSDILTASMALPELPVVIARDMYAAQGYTPDSEARAAIDAHAKFKRTYGFPRGVNVIVRDEFEQPIGMLTFRG